MLKRGKFKWKSHVLLNCITNNVVLYFKNTTMWIFSFVYLFFPLKLFNVFFLFGKHVITIKNVYDNNVKLMMFSLVKIETISYKKKII